MSLWHTTWARHGWEPTVVSQAEAVLCPGFNVYAGRVARYHTSNHRIYEQACFHRWAAMAVTGGGLMTDYDVINYGFTPDDLRLRLAGRTRGLTLLDRFIPCVVYGTAEDFIRAMFLFCSASTDQAGQVSDMMILRSHRSFYASRGGCAQYLCRGWATSKLVHYPASFIPRPRTDKIINIRNPL